MNSQTHKVGSVPKSVLCFLGGLIILLAMVSFITSTTPDQMILWARKVFGWGFIVFYLGLTGLASFSYLQLCKQQNLDYWHEVGQQAANGIATLALTFTLFGISLGIGTLSEQSLSPDTIDSIIADLTRQFSTAFMTTVIGLPTATLVRGALAIRFQHRLQDRKT